MKDFWGVFWLWITYEIHNQCHPFGPMPETFERIFPRYLSFLILLCNFVYNVKAHIKLTGKYTSRTLANMVWTIFNIFNHFWGLHGLFPPGHVIILQIFIFPFLTPLTHNIKVHKIIFKIRSGSCLRALFGFCIV